MVKAWFSLTRYPWKINGRRRRAATKFGATPSLSLQCCQPSGIYIGNTALQCREWRGGSGTAGEWRKRVNPTPWTRAAAAPNRYAPEKRSDLELFTPAAAAAARPGYRYFPLLPRESLLYNYAADRGIRDLSLYLSPPLYTFSSRAVYIDRGLFGGSEERIRDFSWAASAAATEESIWSAVEGWDGVLKYFGFYWETYVERVNRHGIDIMFWLTHLTFIREFSTLSQPWKDDSSVTKSFAMSCIKIPFIILHSWCTVFY